MLSHLWLIPRANKAGGFGRGDIMQTERHRSAARWQSLEAELARTRADLATATAQIEDADTRTETLEASNLELAEARDDADTAKAMPSPAPKGKGRLVHVIEDDAAVRDSLAELLVAVGHGVQVHASAEDFLRDWQPARAACLVVDALLPGMSGLDLLTFLKAEASMPPTIIITGKGDVATAAAAMRLGTLDFLEKPLPAADLLASLDHALAIDKTSHAATEAHKAARKKLDGLSRRERQVLDMVLLGMPSKNISADLGISQRTVENHRAAVMRKAGVRSVPALVRLAIAAEAEAETPAR
jgi:two-component system CheB/CheR fusion protein